MGWVGADAIAGFAARRPGVPVEVRAGRNHILEAELRAGRLDVAVAFFRAGTTAGDRVAALPMRWLAAAGFRPPAGPLPLVLFDHPCLFRQAGLQALERAGIGWRVALTTPSMPGVWAALRAGHGVTVRTGHRVPDGVVEAGPRLGLPELPAIELRLLVCEAPSPAASELRDILGDAVRRVMHTPG